jgi:hypothetical protein
MQQIEENIRAGELELGEVMKLNDVSRPELPYSQ